MTRESLPYGVRDVRVYPLTGETVGTGVDLPNMQTFSFTESEEFQELRGDDRVVTTRGSGPSCEWELEAGGLSLEAVKVINGGTLTVSGLTPNIKKTYAKKANDARPFFRMEGQIISDLGGDVHVLMYRCRMTDELNGEFSDGEFFTTGVSGRGLAKSDGAIYDIVQNETEVAITG